MKERKLIHDWKELASIPKESPTHILEVNLEMCNGHLLAKKSKPYKKNLSYMRQAITQDHYLSTHTFYTKSNVAYASKILRVCGFNVELISWDV